MTPDDIDARLAALEARISVDEPVPAVAASRRRSNRRLVAIVVAPILVVALAATAVGGASLIQVFSVTVMIDPALAGAGLECMTPPEAAVWLASHGYDTVVWDSVVALDAGDAGTALPNGLSLGSVPSPGVLEGTGVIGGTIVVDGTGEILPADRVPEGSPIAIGAIAVGDGTTGEIGATTPPETGIVMVGGVIDGMLHMAVDRTPGATRPATCPAQ